MHPQPIHARTNLKRNSPYQRFMAKRLMSFFTLVITGFTVTYGQLAYGNTFAPSPTPLSVSTTSRLAQAPDILLGNLLLELESNILWKSVEPRWKNRRDGWIRSVRSARTPSQMAALTEELESNVLWSAVDQKWRGRRTGWVRDIRGIRSYGQVGQLLTELERNILWTAVEPAWKDRRDGWLEQIATFSNGPVVTSSTTSTVTTSSSTTVFRNSMANLTRAKNYARQAAEERNGGLRVYRAEAKMHGPVRETGLIENPDGTVTFKFYGGAPAAPPSIESVVTVEINGWRTRIDYNGPIR